MFSRITSKFHAEANSLYKLRDELKGQGHPIRDLISGNINEQGIVFPQNLLEEILVRGARRSAVYRQDSFGQRPAREAITEYYAGCAAAIDPNCILITPGTSMSYWYCFKLLADEGDEILCPCPSYPLFDYIALLSGVKLISYPLDEKQNWTMDPGRLEACVSTKTRAIVLISPHNPTGHIASHEEIAGLAEVASRHNLAIISDEVFSEFLIGHDSLPRPLGSAAPLVFTLNGFSKMFALPGIKFGWMAVSGEPDKVSQAMRSLELISDTFLPVNEIIQSAAPEIFQLGRDFRDDLSRRVAECWDVTEKLLAPSCNYSYTRPDGGFYATLRLSNLDEEQAAETILRENHLLVHPGYFYDMNAHHLIWSFVEDAGAIADWLPNLIASVERISNAKDANWMGCKRK